MGWIRYKSSTQLGGPYRDLTGPSPLDLREIQTQHTFVELGVDLRLIDRLRQTELAEERSRLVLSEDVGLSGGLRRRDLPGERQNAFAQVNLQVLSFHTRHVREDGDRAFVLEDVDGRRVDGPRARLLGNGRNASFFGF